MSFTKDLDESAGSTEDYRAEVFVDGVEQGGDTWGGIDFLAEWLSVIVAVHHGPASRNGRGRNAHDLRDLRGAFAGWSR